MIFNYGLVLSEALNIMDIVGYIAAILTTISFIPQLIKVIKTRNTDSISLIMYILFVVGVICWVGYGIFKVDIPVILANCFTLLFSGFILIIKIINTVKEHKAKKKS
ncbi:MAG TPA: SemiSWEET transporter [Candidatus Onthovivens sp.]|nr:SemiSWEET transporter [Candidatus Onthovivens sp.]